MNTQPLSPETMTQSVWAVPPLARSAEGTLDREANRQIVRHIEAGGLSTLLYGGNAIFYHLTRADFAAALGIISDVADDATTVIPAIGPAYGTMLDQIEVLRDFDFPTAMVLPQRDIVQQAGLAAAIRTAADRLGKPVVLYLKYDRMLAADAIASLVSDGAVSAIKYAVVRDDPSDDPELCELVDAVDPRYILSGLGDQPAWVHLTDFGVGGFTTGCGCVAPKMSAALLAAIRDSDAETAETIRRQFLPLEDLRNAWSPITVLHAAVELAGIAKTGPVIPLLAAVTDDQRQKIADAVRQLRETEAHHASV